MILQCDSDNLINYKAQLNYYCRKKFHRDLGILIGGISDFRGSVRTYISIRNYNFGQIGAGENV